MTTIISRDEVRKAAVGLIWGFNWQTSREGHEYWDGVQMRLEEILKEPEPHTHTFKCSQCGAETKP